MAADTTDAGVRLVTTIFSDGVAKENLINDDSASNRQSFLDACRTATDYYENSVSPGHYDYANFLEAFGEKKLRILDVGVGQGETSVFLATQGHSVMAVEPSLAFCRIIAAAARKFDLDVSPVVAVGEEIDRIGAADFDVVVFNASLHHCDDPMKALANAFQVLKPGGCIFLCSELQLHPWVLKKYWYKRLETHAVEMGHYGGNEHAYYSWEYRSMLRDAGFRRIKASPLALSLDPLRHIEMGITFRIQGQRIWNEWKTLSRTLWYIASAKLIRIAPVFKMLSRASLIPAQFQAVKP